MSLTPFPVEKLVPTEDKIEWVVKQLRNNCSGGESGMQAKHLKWWLVTARKADKDRETSGKEEVATRT